MNNFNLLIISILLFNLYADIIGSAEENFYSISDNTIISNNYKIVLENTISMNDLLIDNNSLYVHSNRNIYSINSTSGTINFKFSVSDVINQAQTENYIYLQTKYNIYKVNKSSGNIEEKRIYINSLEKIYTFFGISGLSGTTIINNYSNGSDETKVNKSGDILTIGARLESYNSTMGTHTGITFNPTDLLLLLFSSTSISTNNILIYPTKTIFTFIDGSYRQIEINDNGINLDNGTLINCDNCILTTGYSKEFAVNDGVVISGTWSIQNLISQTKYYCKQPNDCYSPCVLNSNGNNNNDEYDFNNLYLPTGIYNIQIYYTKYTNHGKMDIKYGNINITTIDEYASSRLYNQLESINFSVTNPSLESLKLIANGKNASSLSYQIDYSWIKLNKIGEI